MNELNQQVENERSTYEIKRLVPRHHLMIDLHVSGMQNKEIGTALGVTKENVYAILSSPLAQAEISRKMSKLEERNIEGLSNVVTTSKRLIENASLEAATTMIDLMKSQDETIKLRSAKDIMDRTFGKENKIGVQNVTIINSGQMAILSEALRETRSRRLGQTEKAIESSKFEQSREIVEGEIVGQPESVGGTDSGEQVVEKTGGVFVPGEGSPDGV